MEFTTFRTNPPKREQLVQEIDEYIVEAGTCMNTRDQVEMFQRSGRILASLRQGQYYEGDEEPPVNPFQQQNLDYVDVQHLAQQTNEALQAVRDAETEKAAQAAEEQRQQAVENARKAKLFDEMRKE